MYPGPVFSSVYCISRYMYFPLYTVYIHHRCCLLIKRSSRWWTFLCNTIYWTLDYYKWICHFWLHCFLYSLPPLQKVPIYYEPSKKIVISWHNPFKSSLSGPFIFLYILYIPFSVFSSVYCTVYPGPYKTLSACTESSCYYYQPSKIILISWHNPFKSSLPRVSLPGSATSSPAKACRQPSVVYSTVKRGHSPFRQAVPPVFSIQSSELGPPTPPPQASVSPPRTQVVDDPARTTRKKAWLCV